MEEMCVEDAQQQSHSSNVSSTLPQSGPGDELEVQYHLSMVGSLPVHTLTTMSMLPWILAEMKRTPVERERLACFPCSAPGPSVVNQPVVLHITAASVWCTLDLAGPGKPWDPLQHAVLWQQRPRQITRLIHNSQDPSYFCCLARQEGSAACHVFHCVDHQRVRGKVCWCPCKKNGVRMLTQSTRLG